MTERNSAVKARSQTMNQIHVLLVTATETVRYSYRSNQGDRLVAVLARTRPAAGNNPAQITRHTLKRLATRHLALRAEITVIDQDIEPIIRALNPSPLATNGVGVVTAATLLISVGDNPERVAPIPASSGPRVRHRLSRGGNRQANHALHRIELIRVRHREPRAIAYFDRRRTQGLSDRDITRCLKRHVANEIYRTLTDPAPEAPAPAPATMTNEITEVIVGVDTHSDTHSDTHADTHHVALINENGKHLGDAKFLATGTGSSTG